MCRVWYVGGSGDVCSLCVGCVLCVVCVRGRWEPWKQGARRASPPGLGEVREGRQRPPTVGRRWCGTQGRAGPPQPHPTPPTPGPTSGPGARRKRCLEKPGRCQKADFGGLGGTPCPRGCWAPLGFPETLERKRDGCSSHRAAGSGPAN